MSNFKIDELKEAIIKLNEDKTYNVFIKHYCYDSENKIVGETEFTYPRANTEIKIDALPSNESEELFTISNL